MAYFKRNGFNLAGTSELVLSNLSLSENKNVAQNTVLSIGEKQSTTETIKYDNQNVKYDKTAPIVKYVKHDSDPTIKSVKEDSEKLFNIEILMQRLTKNFEDKLGQAIDAIREEFKARDQAEKNNIDFTVSKEPENTLVKPEPFYAKAKIKEPEIKYCHPCDISLLNGKKEKGGDPMDNENSQTVIPLPQTEILQSKNTLHNKLRKSHEPICSLELMDDNKEDDELEETEEELLYEIKEDENETEQEEDENEKEENEKGQHETTNILIANENESPEVLRIKELEQQIEELKFLLISKSEKEKPEIPIKELNGAENSETKTLPRIEPDAVENENEEDYRWIESDLIKKTENEYANNKAERLFADPVTYFGVEQIFHVKWVTVRFRCLVESLLCLSNYSSIDRHTLFCVTDAFIRLAQSRVFQKLPASYPYTELIKELCFKLHKIANENRNSEKIVFRLPVERKALLMSIRYLLIRHVPEMKFSEIDFTDEKSPFELMEEKFSKRLEDEREEKKSKKGWELRFEAEKRKERLNNAA